LRRSNSAPEPDSAKMISPRGVRLSSAPAKNSRMLTICPSFVGDTVGAVVGLSDGCRVGPAVGNDVGARDVGKRVGGNVGSLV